MIVYCTLWRGKVWALTILLRGVLDIVSIEKGSLSGAVVWGLMEKRLPSLSRI